MMLFRFIGTKSDGSTICGNISAETKLDAESELKKSEICIKFLQNITTLGKTSQTKFRSSSSKFSRQKYEFFEQLSTLMLAGLTVEQSLNVFSEKFLNNPELSNIVSILKFKIASGMSLSEAMTCCNGAFLKTEIKTIFAAENIGRPALAIKKLAESGKKKTALKKKIKSSLIYPLIVFASSIVALIILMTLVVPRFQIIFEEHRTNSRLPAITTHVINACNFLHKNLITIIAISILTILIIKVLQRNKNLSKHLDTILLYIPIFGNLRKLINLNNFFQVIGMLMSFGANLQESFCMAVDVINDKKIKQSFRHMFKRLTHGEQLSNIVNGNKYLQATDHGLVLAGEYSGTLGDAFNKISSIYEQMIENKLTILSAMAEPVIIVFLAIFVGTIAIGLFLPMLTLVEGLKI